MSDTIVLEPGDLQVLRDRQQLINMEKFKVSMLELAFNVIKANTLQKYGLNPDKNYQIDGRGVVIPLVEENPEQESPGS